MSLSLTSNLFVSMSVALKKSAAGVKSNEDALTGALQTGAKRS